MFVYKDNKKTGFGGGAVENYKCRNVLYKAPLDACEGQYR